RDPRRRRQVQPRRDRGRPRRGRALLSDLARHRRAGGAPDADRGLRDRCHRDGGAVGGAAPAFAPAARRLVGTEWERIGMTVVSPFRPAANAGFDVRRIRRDFPIFERNPGLIFLDTAASAQKPKPVIDGVAEFYRTDYANVHRGVYRLSSASTDQFEKA